MTSIAQQLAADAARAEAAGVPFNPELPPDFDNTPNERRPSSHQPWWHRPYVCTVTVETWKRWTDAERAKWIEAWPSGIRYDVRCLDGGAWDRSTSWGSFATLDDALACIAAGRPWGRRTSTP